MKQWTRLLLALPLAAGLCLAPVPPAALAQAPAEVWVCPSGACGHTPGLDAFNAVQAGVDAVAPGGTVHVAAGTYDESLTVARALTLEGAGAASTTIRGATTLAAAGITARGFTFTNPGGPGAGEGYIVRLSGAGGALLEDCALTAIDGYATSYGLLVVSTSGATCRRLTIGGVAGSTEAAGLMVGDGATSNTFESLTVDGVTSPAFASGVRLASAQGNTLSGLTIANVVAGAGHPARGIECLGGSGQRFDGVGISALQGLQVQAAYLSAAQSTTLRDVRYDAAGSSADQLLGIVVDLGSSGVAVEDSLVTHAERGIGVGGTSVTVTGCRLVANAEGVQVYTGGTATLHGNDLSGNASYAVYNKNPSATVDATGNWWGSPTGPATAGPNAVTSRVAFSPWLGDGTDTSDEPGFQPNAGPLYATPTRLAFATQPGGASAGSLLSPQPVVRAEDAEGHLGINFSGPVALAILANPAGGTLSGPNPVAALQGVAAFDGLAVDAAGAGYTLRATAGGLSAATSAPFDVAAPAPTLASLTPDHATAGAPALTLAVSGAGFLPGALVRWDGAARSTSYVSATELTAAILAADLAAPGTATVTVANPDGGSSSGLPFTILRDDSIRPRPATVYVDPAWAGTAADADPDGAGPATHYGYDAFASAQQALAAVAPGGRVVVAGGALAGGLVVATDGLTIDLDGATVGPGSPAFTVSADDVTIEDGILDGAGDTSGSAAIVVSPGVARLWVHDCEIRSWPADGIHFEGPVAGLKIVDNDIHGNGGDGIEFNGSPTAAVLISGNSLRDNAGYGINAVTGSVAAPYNEWGHVDGPAAGDGVSGDVSASPWVFGRLYVDVAPDPAHVREGAEFDVDVRADAAGLYGAQFALAFDPALLEVVSVAAGGAGYFTGALPATVAYDNAAGTLACHGSRQAPEPPYSGLGGQLLTVRFRARPISGAAATAAVDLVASSVRLAAPGGIGILVDSLAGDSLTIMGETSLSGVVRLQGRDDWSGATVDASPGLATSFDPAPALSDAWGRYALALVDDRYTITAAMPRYLAATALVDVAGGAQALGAVELLGGDVDGAGGVAMNDITAISGLLFGTVVDPATTPADVNYDGWVDILDLVLAAGNYGLTASPWSP